MTKMILKGCSRLNPTPIKLCILALVACFIFCASCASFQQRTSNKILTYNIHKNVAGHECALQYQLRVPKTYRITTVEGGSEKELRLLYADSSHIYITNDNQSGSSLNYNNVQKIGPAIYTRKLLSDTLLLEGIQSNGRCWKESKLGDITVGYANVISKDKLRYNEALSTLKLVRKRCEI